MSSDLHRSVSLYQSVMPTRSIQNPVRPKPREVTHTTVMLSEASEIPPGHIVAVLRPPRSRHTLPQCLRSASVQASAGAVREPPLLRFRSE